MIRNVVPSDIDFADKLIKGSRPDAEIVAALGRRGVGRVDAGDLLQALRSGGAGACRLAEWPQAARTRVVERPAEPPRVRDPLGIGILEVFLILSLVYQTYGFAVVRRLLSGRPFPTSELDTATWISISLQQVFALAFLFYMLYRRSRFGQMPSFGSRGQRSAKLGSRWLLVFELVLVIGVTFQSSILHSIALAMENPVIAEDTSTASEITLQVWHLWSQLSDLGVLGYVLYRSRTFAWLGLSWTSKDFALALPLGVSAMAISTFSVALAHWAVPGLFGPGLYSPDESELISVISLLPLLVNGFCEELIVRAYLMTMVERLTKSVLLAIVLSVAVQMSYHFYQGVAAALSHAGWCLLFSIFYWRTRRALPLVVAHNFFNLTLYVLKA